FTPTAGAQSMRTFRHRYMHHSILIDCNDRALALARDAYRGARCEVFKHGKQKGEWFYLDVNALYPTVMHDMWVPVKLLGTATNVGIDDLRRWSTRFVVIADVEFTTNLPVFAVRDAHQLSFKSGKQRATLCGQELDYAFDRLLIGQVFSAAVYYREIA